MKFQIDTKFKPSGDQPEAINKLIKGLESNKKDQILFGITGSGKTFTIANIIERTQRPAVIMVHNKTLAAQLYNEMKNFFPKNAIEYFISYYDYYQPEAYLSSTDTYIEKDSSINSQIDQLRHSATMSIMERKDVVIVCSVSAIYGLGNPDEYSAMTIRIQKQQKIELKEIKSRLVDLQYKRNDMSFERGSFMIKGDLLYIFPPSADNIAVRIDMFGDDIESINEFDVITGKKIRELDFVNIYPNGHHVTTMQKLRTCTPLILKEMEERVLYFKSIGKFAEAQRLETKVRYDIEMMTETGSCKGIENYSRYLAGKEAGEPPITLFNYIPKDAILFLDESHITLPQIKAMYSGDRARKENLIDYGFRLPSAFDNRPLKIEEWENIRPQTIFVSATPAKIELEKTQGEVVEQLIRPTGLLDPICEIKPTEGQIQDAMIEILKAKEQNLRTICITITKAYSEKLSEYLTKNGIKAEYIHSDVKTLERIEIIKRLKQGKLDAIIGINLLREGIDIPECGLVLILDADKEGFLRSETALIQIIGRAARNSAGKVILYADKFTDAIKKATEETSRRRAIQIEFNKKHNIIPTTTTNAIKNIFDDILEEELDTNLLHYKEMSLKQIETEIEKLTKVMKKAAKKLDFDIATQTQELIEKIKKIKEKNY